jgi:hypothetical protein
MTEAKLAKAKRRARKPQVSGDTATITYHPGPNAHSVEIGVPVKPGSGERVINTAEKHGADVEHVREQIKALPHAERN